MIGHHFQRLNRDLPLFGFFLKQVAQILLYGAHQNLATVLWTPDQVIFQRINYACTTAIFDHRYSIARHLIFYNYQPHRGEEVAKLPMVIG